ncbi:MAG: hypothetical protein QOF48_2579 [Verrucomicrobiota bacterium]|jgi:hypothetical protein
MRLEELMADEFEDIQAGEVLAHQGTMHRRPAAARELEFRRDDFRHQAENGSYRLKNPLHAGLEPV